MVETGNNTIEQETSEKLPDKLSLELNRVFRAAFSGRVFASAFQGALFSGTVVRTVFRAFLAEGSRRCLTLGRWLPPAIVLSLPPATLSSTHVDDGFGSCTNSSREIGFCPPKHALQNPSLVASLFFHSFE